METKRCRMCGNMRPIDDFYVFYSKPTSRCKECSREVAKEYREKHPFHNNEYKHSHGICRPLVECTDSNAYLGIYIAEPLLKSFFTNARKMPTGNPGYDYTCGSGYKIDVKGACSRRNRSLCWDFNIDQNTVADYFLCIAFDNRRDLNVNHVWLIPGMLVNHVKKLTIHGGTKSLDKWAKFEKHLNGNINGAISVPR